MQASVEKPLTIDNEFRFPQIGGLFLLVAIVCLLGIGNTAFTTQAEARVAEVAKQMIETGDWLVPRLGNQLRLEKPPLAYWQVAVASSILGGVNEVSARLPSALYGIALCVLVFFFARKHFDDITSASAVIVLVFSIRFITDATQAKVEMTIAFWQFAALLCIIRADDGLSSKLSRIALWVCLAMGFLAKGPFGMMLPIASVIFMAVIRREFKPIRLLWSPIGVLLFALICAPWYLCLFHYVPDAWDVMFTEMAGRVGSGKDHRAPFYYYILNLPVTFHIFALFSVAAFRQWRRDSNTPARMWILVSAISFFIVISLGSSKREYYMLPLIAPVAILIGRGMAVSFSEKRIVKLATFLAALYLIKAFIFAPMQSEHKSIVPLAELINDRSWNVAEYRTSTEASLQFYTNRAITVIDKKDEKEVLNWIEKQDNVIVVKHKTYGKIKELASKQNVLLKVLIEYKHRKKTEHTFYVIGKGN